MPPHVVDLDRRLNLMKVIAHAQPLVQVLLLAILLLVAASIALWARQLAGARRASDRADALLSAVLVGAPLLGLMAGAYGVMDMFIGAANVVATPGLAALSPGFAEVGFCVLSGLTAAFFAVAFRTHLRIRRAKTA